MLCALQARSLQEGGKVRRGVEPREQMRVAPAEYVDRCVGISGSTLGPTHQDSRTLAHCKPVHSLSFVILGCCLAVKL